MSSYKRRLITPEKDRIGQENSQLIHQLAADIGGGSGEVNSGSNVGTDGIGVFDGKVVYDLQFRHITSVNPKLTVVLNGKDIDLTVVVGTSGDTVCVGNDSRLSDARTPTQHNNTYHSTNYEVANANIQSHVASPVTDAHHTKYLSSTAHAYVEANILTLAQPLTIKVNSGNPHDTNWELDSPNLILHELGGSYGSENMLLFKNELGDIPMASITAKWVGSTQDDGSLGFATVRNSALVTQMVIDPDGNLALDGDITLTGTVDGIDIAGRDHAKYTNAEAVLAVEATGLSLDAGQTYTSVLEDSAHTFGRMQLNSSTEAGTATLGYSGYGGSGNQYALRQNSSFNTWLNAKSGGNIYIGVNEANMLHINANGVQIGGSGARINEVDNDDNLGTSHWKLSTQGNIKAYHDANKTVAGDLSHNSLANLNAGTSYEHISQTQKDALHAIQHAMDNTTYHTIGTGTTFNATTTKHGFLKQLDNDALKFMNGQGNWAVPTGEGSGSVKGQLQGHIIPIAGCSWGSSMINMYDNGDSASCSFDLTVNVDSSEDIKIVLVYASQWDNQCAIHIFMAIRKTNASETHSWNYLNDVNIWLSTPSIDWGIRRYTWTIPSSVFDTNDTVTVHWANNNSYDYRAHSMYLLYTETS